MGFLSIVTMFIGYLLVYAGIANHGRFATAPWLGVLTDAYSTPDSGSGAPGIPPSGVPGKGGKGKGGGGGGPGLGIIPKLPVPQGPVTGIPFSPLSTPVIPRGTQTS